ncbi:hypothetical protein [Paracoccus salsus]|nr:hypothetical protein [Paracoccus salsus]MCF3974007.1 hypothetical protein [Paracoccus salsus]
MIDQDEVFVAFHSAFTNAINELGVDALKRTSLFGSNDRAIKRVAA